MKQARLAAGWLKQKTNLLPVLLILILASTFVLPVFATNVHAAAPGSAEQTCIDQGGKPQYATGNAYIGCSTTDASGKTSTDNSGDTSPASNNVGTGNSTPESDADVAAKAEDPCDASTNPLSWFVCPIIGIINEGVRQMQDIIDKLMEFDVKPVFDRSTASGNAYYTAWNSFRLFAIAFVVIAGLVMVISQALGFDIFDAYTIKKVMPRLFIAAIAISLSWYLLRFLAEFTNVVGIGIRSVIYYPFKDIGGAGLQSTGGYLLTTLLGAAAFAALTIGGVLSLVATAGLAALIAFLVLILRQMVLIFLIIISPIAIACFILPNTERTYKLWWDSIAKGFMMFPIITAFIATGKVFSAVASSAPGASAINQVIAVIAFFLPYFAIPFTFRLAGGAIATIGGLANDRSRGMFDNLKGYRKNAMVEGWQRKKNSNTFRGGNDSNWRGKINRGVAGTINAPGAIKESGNLLAPTKWAGATRANSQARAFGEIERNMKENHAYQPWMFDDGLNKAASRTNNAGELRQYLIDNNKMEAGSRELDDAVNHIETVRRSMDPTAFKAMTARQALAGGTAYKTSTDPGAIKTAAGEAWADVARASVNDDALAGYLVANGRSEGMKAGRIDYAGAGFGTTITQVNRMRKELRENGSISQATIEDVTRKIHADAYSSQGGASLVHSSMKPDAVRDMAPQMINDIEMARATGTDRDYVQSLASLKAVYEGLNGSSPAKAKIMADEVFNKTIDIGSLRPSIRQKLAPILTQRQPDGTTSLRETGTITYQQALDALSGDQEFRQMRREYGNAIENELSHQPPEPGSPPSQLP